MHKRIVLLLALFLIPMSGVGTDLYAPSLPAIRDVFHISDALAKLTITTFLFGCALGQIFFGTISDAKGRKITLIAGLSLFIIASVIAPFVQNIYVLLAMRFIQGAGIAAPSAVSKSLLSDHFEGKELQSSSTYLSTAWGLGPIIAPFIGGYLQHYFNWQANFYALIAYGVLALLAVILLQKESNLNPTTFSLRGLTQNFLAVSTSWRFLGHAALMGIAYGLIVSFHVFAPFLIQVDLGYSAVVYGHMALVIGIFFFLGAAGNRILINHFDVDTLLKTAIIISLVVSAMMAVGLYFVKMSLLTITAPVCIVVACSGVIYPNCIAKLLKLFSHLAGTASAVMGLLSVLIATIATLIASPLQSATQTPMGWFYFSATVIYIVIWALLSRHQPKAT